MNWVAITNLGDSALMLPMVGAVIAWLVAIRAWGVARRWLLLTGAVIAAVAVTKLAFLGWGIGIRPLDFTGISGHAALATTVAPVAAGLMAGGATARGSRLAAMLAGYALGVAVAASRVVLHYHSLSEVIAGCAVGGAASFAMAEAVATLPRPSTRPIVALALVLAAIFLTADGNRAPSERFLMQAAIALSGAAQVHSRSDWQTASSTNTAPYARD